MNTTPDETRLALWLDDELTGAERAEMDAWAAGSPGHLAAREEIRAYRRTMAAALPAREEPPYPEFFLSRINQGIRDLRPHDVEPAPVPPDAPFWRSWLMPLAACAGMVLSFGVGQRMASRDAAPLAVVPAPAPVLYTPEDGVDAEWFANSVTDATVIVLQGVSAIPDSTDFSETVHVPTASESDRTAGQRKQEQDKDTQ